MFKRCIFLYLISLFSLRALADGPQVGQAAPPLTFTELQQAPPGAVASWEALKGKVVVLEFWATWCSGCVQQIPHMNQLISDMSGKGIQFIAVDDEEPAVATKFLDKMKMPIQGWLGFDTSKKIIEAYNVRSFPCTVVVDAQGRVVAVTRPPMLTKERLLALADGKPVTFPKEIEGASYEEMLAAANKEFKATASGGEDGPKPLFVLSIRPGDPHGVTTMRSQKIKGATVIDVSNANLLTLYSLLQVFPSTRVIVSAEQSTRILAEYLSLHLEAPSGDLERMAPMLEQAIHLAAGIQAHRMQREEEVWTLVKTDAADKLLTAAQDLPYSYCNYNPQDGKVVMAGAKLEMLDDKLESLLKIPVLNETGLTGKYIANFDLPAGDGQAINAVFEKKLGLRLVKANRTVEHLKLEMPEK